MRLSPALLLVLAPFASIAYAADPEFKVGLVTESRAYERDDLVALSPSIGLPPTATKASINRVTVTLEGERITGEWQSYGSKGGALAKDFPLGTEVQAATKGNRLLLKHPDGSVVSARIVRRVKPE